MSEELSARPRRVYIRNGFIAFLAIFLFLLLVGPLYTGAKTVSVWTLMAGWLFAAFRLVSSLSISARTLFLFTLGVVISFLLAHHFATWLTRQASPHSEQPRLWSFRRSGVALSGATLILFAAMAIVGAMHQTVWAFTSGEEMFADSSARGMRALQLSRSTRNAAYYGEFDLGRSIVQMEQWRLGHGFRQPEAHRVSYIPGRDGKIAGIIVLRHPAGPWDFRHKFLASGGDGLVSQTDGTLEAIVSRLSESSRSPAEPEGEKARP
jgi:hypothetical protein